MKWTEAAPPTEGISHYDHVTLTSPIGDIVIEWKSWKERPSYDVEMSGVWVGCEYDLQDAKKLAENYLRKISDDLVVAIKKLDE